MAAFIFVFFTTVVVACVTDLFLALLSPFKRSYKERSGRTAAQTLSQQGLLLVTPAGLNQTNSPTAKPHVSPTTSRHSE